MKILKIIKLISCNLLILFILLIIFEFCLFVSFKKSNPKIEYNLKNIDYKETLKSTYPRGPVGLQYKNRPIILLGCSFIYGLYLEGEHTPQYKLSEMTNRPVYNWALPGKGLQHTLYILQNKLYDTDIKNPEYAIYVMIYDHVRRMYSPVSFNDVSAFPVYKLGSNGRIMKVSDVYPIYKKFFTYYYINNLIYFNFTHKNVYQAQKLCFAYFREIRRLLQQTYPDIKFVILLYDDWHKFGFNFARLEREGFIVLQTKELTGEKFLVRKYWVSDTDTHPTEEAWDIIIPAMVKKLEL